MPEHELVPQLIGSAPSDLELARGLQQRSPTQRFGLPDTRRTRSTVATHFVLEYVDTAAGTLRQGFPGGALRRGLLLREAPLRMCMTHLLDLAA